MTPTEKLHVHHEKLIGTIRNLVERTKSDPADASLLVSFCSEHLVAHAEAEEVTLYRADTDTEFVEKMTHEHREIRDSLEAIGSATGRGDSAGIISQTGNFIAILERHFGEEENTLMPKLSKMLAPEELEALIKEAHEIETEKKKSDVWLLFEQDHKRIDINISRLAKTEGDKESSRSLYAKVRAQLFKHIELEETVLFPMFGEYAAPGQAGPVQVMIAEHREITSLLVTAGDSLDEESFAGHLGSLVGKLAVHNKKEELILYPLIKRTLPPAERAKAFKECFEGFVTV